MKEYEVIREIFNACSGKWEIDNSFTREVSCSDPEALLRSWFPGEKMPSYQVDTLPDGTVEYVLDPPQRERYSFSAF